MYYDGTKLLSMLDIDNYKPEIYICCGNRTAGKTTFFSRYLVNRYKKYHEKFCLIYRYSYELKDACDMFFNDIKYLFFKSDNMSAKPRCNGVFYELFYNSESCGYAISLNSADAIKKRSHLMSDVSNMFFDEFQSENNNYCLNEIDKLFSIHVSLARGHGKLSKRLPLFMCSNFVSLMNPYFVALSISDRLNNNTKFLRGEGFVLEFTYNEFASAAQSSSAFNRAFKSSKYYQYSCANVYLNDSISFIDNISEKTQYICTINYDNSLYSIKLTDSGLLYVDNKIDNSFPVKYSFRYIDHKENFKMLSHNSYHLELFKSYFNRGDCRFKNQLCKKMFFSLISSGY